MDRECRILARRIFVMSMLISEKTKADCFFYYHPHVNGIDVCLYPDGWKEGEKPIRLATSYTRYNEKSLADVFDYLEEFMGNAEWQDLKLEGFMSNAEWEDVK